MNYNQLLGMYLENNINTLVYQLLGNVREELRSRTTILNVREAYVYRCLFCVYVHIYMRLIRIHNALCIHVHTHEASNQRFVTEFDGTFEI